MTQRAKPAVRRWNAIVRISAALVLLAWLPLLPARAQDPGAGTAATATTPNPVEALIERGTMAMWTDPDASKREADEALELLKKNPDPDREIRARLLICDYQSERDTAAAQREIAAATALLSQATRQGLRAGILDCEGESLENSGDNTKAMAQYTEAASVATSEHDDEMLALSLYSRGYLLGVMGDYATGLIELRRADALFEKLKKPLHELVTLNSIATIYNRMGDYVQARHIYTRALAAQRQAGLQREQVVTLYNLGRANENLHDWDASRTAFAETLEISRKINYLRGEAYGMRGLAAVANALGDPEGALDTLKSAEVIQKQVPDSRLRAQIQLARGIALHKLQRLPESTQALESALVDFRQADALYELNQVYSELAAVYAETGNWRDAYARQVDAKTTSDKLLKNQLDQGFATLKVEFDTATQDKENAALKKQNEANQRALAQARSVRRLQATVIILTISLVLLLTLLAVFQHRSTLRMHLLAMTDELTGVPNRRAVLGRLDPLLRRDDRGVLHSHRRYRLLQSHQRSARPPHRRRGVEGGCRDSARRRERARLFRASGRRGVPHRAAGHGPQPGACYRAELLREDRSHRYLTLVWRAAPHHVQYRCVYFRAWQGYAQHHASACRRRSIRSQARRPQLREDGAGPRARRGRGGGGRCLRAALP
jgi:tetratricopeptide (TPR) repeat protein